MPSAEFMAPKAMGDALEAGKIDQATLDDKVRRILRVCVANDMAGTERAKTEPKDDPANATVARREAERGHRPTQEQRDSSSVEGVESQLACSRSERPSLHNRRRRKRLYDSAPRPAS